MESDRSDSGVNAVTEGLACVQFPSDRRVRGRHAQLAPFEPGWHDPAECHRELCADAAHAVITSGVSLNQHASRDS